MGKRWFFKTTESIPYISDGRPFRQIGDKKIYVKSVHGGLNTSNGHVYIDYGFYRPLTPWFWIAHFHEFLHRIFWKIDIPLLHTVIDTFDGYINFYDHIKYQRLIENDEL